MPVWLQVVVYIVAILSLVMIHEAGHFLTAKAFGIKVQEFFVGFGPRLWSFRRGETEYGLKALPFGGYVRIAGMNPFEEIPPEDVSRTFQAKPIWQRAIVIATGPVTHFVMAVVFAAVLVAVVGTPSRYRAEVVSVERTLNGLPSPASRVGLRAGDVIESVNGRRVPVGRDPGVINGVIGATRESVGKPIVVGIRREGRLMIFRPIPELSDVDGEPVGRIGVIIGSRVVAVEHANPIVALGRGAMFSFERGKEIIFQFDNVFGPSGLSRLANQVLGRETRGEGDVSSVVGGGQILVQASEEIGFGPALLQLLVVFNIFIGILNLVPLPPLDGGHLAVLVYEKVRRRRPDVRKLIPLTALVAAFMIVFALSILYLDIVRPIQIP